ncbi:MAG: pyocin activator PrtN family protein [Cohaesibacteraceae bacterium]|nr:pyocin activator PrtN family protein [Cohaesibacteraceae bacterium]MBL4876161.1 pyocin activator PrtN family protein [Cohaesibacteraceae bacterium]
MNTAFLLMAQYGGQAIIPLETVGKDYFDMTRAVFFRKINDGKIKIPVVRMEMSQKCARGVHIDDLARYLDERLAAARKEHEALFGR